MTLGSAPLFSDADVRRFLVARADAVASRAAPADDMTVRVAVQLGLARSRRGAPLRALRLAVVVVLLAALAAGALYLIGRFSEDYSPAQPEVTVNLHGSPWAIAALGGSIWSTGYREAVLFEVEPSTGEVLAEIPTGKRICGTLASEFGYLWFTSCPDNAYLGRVDPATGHIDRLNGYGGDRIGFGGGLVWVIHDGALEGLDPTTLLTIETIPVQRGGIVVYAQGSVWISDADGGVVARIDPVARRLVAEIIWPANGDGRYPVHMTEADGAIWVVDETQLAVLRIDPATNVAIRVDVDLEPIDGTSFGDHPIAFGGGELWVRESETSLVRINTASLTVAERVVTAELGGGAFVSTDDALWYANLKGDTIVGLQRP